MSLLLLAIFAIQMLNRALLFETVDRQQWRPRKYHHHFLISDERELDIVHCNCGFAKCHKTETRRAINTRRSFIAGFAFVLAEACIASYDISLHRYAAK